MTDRSACGRCGAAILPKTFQRLGGICMPCFKRANQGRTPEKIDHVTEFPCPCCGYLTLQTSVAHGICPICLWDDDPAQLRDPLKGRGRNRVSLSEAQKNFEELACSTPDLVSKVRPVVTTDRRDTTWRKFDAGRDAPRADDGKTREESPYYWRKGRG